MKLKNQNKITTAILFFSLILIFSGLYIYSLEDDGSTQYNDQEILYTPTSDPIKIDDSNSASDTNNDSNTNTEDNKSSKENDSNDKTEVQQKSNNNSSSNILEKNIPLSIEQQNDRLRSSLEAKYDIAIRYGEETSNYTIGGMATTTIKDPYKIQSVLNELSIDLSQYPTGFFREFAKKDLYLTIYLIDKYSTENVTGVTDPRTNNVTISIATAYPFSESFYHESFHYMERYIKLNGGTFNSWDVFNPKDFIYGVEDLSYSYANTLSKNSYFVNSYAETAADEDRASTFEFMMASQKASVFEDGTPIMNKAKYLADTIDLFFTTVNSTTVEYWERYL